MMKLNRLVLSLLLVSAGAASALAVPEGHPRLFADKAAFQALKARLGADAALDATMTIVRRNAERCQAVEPLTREMSGRRLLGTCRKALQRVSNLALAARLLDDRKAFDRCVVELKALCAFTDWNPSHFLDVAEMSLAVATGYDWLYDDLSPEDRELIASTLQKKGFEECLKGGRRKGRTTTYHYSLTTGNNWGQVCNCGAIAAALALRERIGAERTDAFVRACAENLRIPMAVYAPHGCYPEGPGYWNYGTDFNVLALAMIEFAYGTSWGLVDLPGFRETGSFPERVCGPTGIFFNYSDAGLVRDASISPWWFARRFGQPELVSGWEFEALRSGASNEKFSGDRTMPYQVFWIAAPAEGSRRELPLTWRSEGCAQLAIQRSGWGKDDIFVGLKAGTPSANHGHMDVGSFVFDADGVRWAWDLGGEGYGRIEAMGLSLWAMSQQSDRWTIYRLNNRGHNTLMVDGQPQLVGGNGTVLSLTDGPESESRLDLTGVAANVCTNWIRSGRMGPGGRTFVLADRMTGLKPGAEVRWAMITKAKATAAGETLHLEQGGKRLDLVQAGPNRGSWEVLRAGTDAPQDSPNRNCKQVLFRVAAPDDGQVRLLVRFERR